MPKATTDQSPENSEAKLRVDDAPEFVNPVGVTETLDERGSLASSLNSIVPSPFPGLLFLGMICPELRWCFTPGFTTPHLRRLCGRPTMVNGQPKRPSTYDGPSECYPHQFLIHWSCGDGLDVDPIPVPAVLHRSNVGL